MTTTRKLNRNQRAAYAGGSSKLGWYQFSVQGTEESGASRTYYTITGERAAAADEARQTAWRAGREWVAEGGEVVKTDAEYRATRTVEVAQ